MIAALAHGQVLLGELGPVLDVERRRHATHADERNRPRHAGQLSGVDVLVQRHEDAVSAADFDISGDGGGFSFY